MKKIVLYILTYAIVVSLALSLFSCGLKDAISGGSTESENSETQAPSTFSLIAAGNYLIWDEYEGAESYTVLINSQPVTTVTDTAYYCENSFEKAEVIAKVGDKEIHSEAVYNNVFLETDKKLVISSAEMLENADLTKYNYLVFELAQFDTKGIELSIPKNVNRVEIVGQQNVVYTEMNVDIAARSNDITMAIKDLTATAPDNSHLIIMNSIEGRAPCLIVECGGISSLSGGNGSDGAAGSTGDTFQHATTGATGSNGCSAIKAERVLITGSGRASFCGGAGGNGGKGGFGNVFNNPGNGGTGGNGGDAVTANEAIVFMESGAMCYFTAGVGGAGGQAGDKDDTSFGSSSAGASGQNGNAASCDIRRIRGIVK